MLSCAVFLPMALSPPPRYFFIDNNGKVGDFAAEYQKDNIARGFWTRQEKEAFKQKFLEHPKDFGLIAQHLQTKSTQDCVNYYYQSKREENYKVLLSKLVLF